MGYTQNLRWAMPQNHHFIFILGFIPFKYPNLPINTLSNKNKNPVFLNAPFANKNLIFFNLVAKNCLNNLSEDNLAVIKTTFLSLHLGMHLAVNPIYTWIGDPNLSNKKIVSSIEYKILNYKILDIVYSDQITLFPV